MKTLVAEDDLASRRFMVQFLSQYGECDSTVDGLEAVEAFKMAFEAGKGYDLVCMDIMMPEQDGYESLREIRSFEREHGLDEMTGAKIIMTTALADGKSVQKAFDLGCIAYASKPIDKNKFERELKKLGLI